MIAKPEDLRVELTAIQSQLAACKRFLEQTPVNTTYLRGAYARAIGMFDACISGVVAVRAQIENDAFGAEPPLFSHVIIEKPSQLLGMLDYAILRTTVLLRPLVEKGIDGTPADPGFDAAFRKHTELVTAINAFFACIRSTHKNITSPLGRLDVPEHVIARAHRTERRKAIILRIKQANDLIAETETVYKDAKASKEKLTKELAELDTLEFDLPSGADAGPTPPHADTSGTSVPTIQPTGETGSTSQQTTAGA